MKPGELSLECKDEKIENHTGFSSQVLVDLQKVVCCLILVKLEADGEQVTNSHRVHFKEAAACFDYSSRITLALRQSTVWKFFGLSQAIGNRVMELNLDYLRRYSN